MEKFPEKIYVDRAGESASFYVSIELFDPPFNRKRVFAEYRLVKLIEASNITELKEYKEPNVE